MRVDQKGSLLLLGLFTALACHREPDEIVPGVQKTYVAMEAPAPVIMPEEAARRACERRLREVLAEPAVPGVPALETDRAVFLAQVKAEPVIFLRAPDYEPRDVSLTVRGYRQMLLSGQNPFGTVQRILAESKGLPKQARDTFLRDGYLFDTNPRVGYWLVNLIEPGLLFGHDRIWIQRGEQVLHAVRRGETFYYVDGLLEGQRARLLLFDRAGPGDDPPAPLHRDVRSLRYRLHFNRMEIRHVTEGHIIANLRYGRLWVPSVLRTSGAHVELDCEILDRALERDVTQAREEATRRDRMVQALRVVLLAELDEALPFDEPRHEYGFQLDGTLRGMWLAAYTRGRNTFDFNGDEYRVFDAKGRPLVPEVCVDFLTDTLERASGAWWRPRGNPPGRTAGKFDFEALAGDEAVEMRRAPRFVDFAKAHPEAFEVLDDPELVELGHESAFFAHLREHLDDFTAGDAILIKGKTPWDRGHVHFHSFFVYETDPVTGMPISILGNAGRPSLRPWETEIRRTPGRAIVHRIRLRTEWLEKILALPPLEDVPPLAAGSE